MARKLQVVRIIQDLVIETDENWDIQQILQLILHSLDDVLEFKHSMIYLLHDDGDTLLFQSGWGYPVGHAGAPVQVGQGFIGMVARSGEVLRINDLRKIFQYTKAVRFKTMTSSLHNQLAEPTPMLGLSNPESIISVPLKTKLGVIGVIVVESERASAFDKIDQELLLLVAGQTARLIEEVRKTELNKRKQEGLLYAKVHLDQLNTFLDTIMTAASLGDSSTYAAAMAKQMKGFSYANKQSELARTYFEEAAAIFQDIGMSLEMVRSKLGAAVLSITGQPHDAVQMLQECLKGFEACGALGYAQLTSTMLARLTPHENGLQQLTKREREIAQLIAQGLSSAEAADQLFISVRTVSTHLDNIYDKLQLRSRSALSHFITQNT
jgi:DNA-binding CsgD family transcriptional regulator/putative methionine-R-sulfoxide reductase with GAF domain